MSQYDYENHTFQPNEKVTQELKGLYEEALTLLDKNPSREGLKETPKRIAKSLQFLTQGNHIEPKKIIEKALFKEDYKQMVIVKNIDIYSLCEHHLLPFWGKAHVAYIPNKHITGLSKIARVVDAYARRLQVQERLTMQIKDALEATLAPLGVAIVIEATHLCMVMRGIQKQNSVTTTSDFTGVFKNIATREEFMSAIQNSLT